MLPDRWSTQVWRSFLAALLALLASAGLILPAAICLSTVAAVSTRDVVPPPPSADDGRQSPADEHNGNTPSANPYDPHCPRTAVGKASVATRPWCETTTSLGLRATCHRKTQGLAPTDAGSSPTASCLHVTAPPHEINSPVLRI